MIAFALGLNYVYAWTAPTVAPPNGNVSAPINVGTTDQVKNGGLSVNAFSAFGNAYVQGSLGVGDVTPDGGLKVDVEGNVGAINYCDQNGTNCVAATALASGGTVTPNFESGWIAVRGGQTGEIVHSLGTDQLANFQIIVRQSATNNDEVIIQGMQAGSDGYFNGATFYGKGLQFFIDKSDNPTMKVKWYTADHAGFDSAHRVTFPTTSGMNWNDYSLGIFNGPTFEMKIRIWTSSGGSGTAAPSCHSDRVMRVMGYAGATKFPQFITCPYADGSGGYTGRFYHYNPTTKQVTYALNGADNININWLIFNSDTGAKVSAQVYTGQCGTPGPNVVNNISDVISRGWGVCQ